MLLFFQICYLLSCIWAIVSILLYGSRPSRSISWMFIVVLFPILGVILYIIFGINRKKFKFFRLNYNTKRKLYKFSNARERISFTPDFSKEEHKNLSKLLENSSGFAATNKNEIIPLFSGKETYESIFNDLKNASKFIHLQYYIFENGKVLDELLELFEEKIKQNVEIRILYDAFGSFGWKNKQVKKLKKLGVEIFPIMPLKLGSILTTLNYRNHRKIVIIDGEIAYTGGVNISDKYISKKNNLGIWDDLHLKIKGSSVAHLHEVFIKDYYFSSSNTLLSNDKFFPNAKNFEGNTTAQIITGGPDHDYLSILHQYEMMIHIAEKSIYIENPYFIPNKSLLEALKMAVLRGVSVKIMIPKNNDSKLAKHSMYSNFEELLKVGVEIFVLQNKFSHSKLMIVDESLSSVGSGNFDYRSFEHNYEVNTLIYDAKVTQQMVSDFNNSLKDCILLTYESFTNRGFKTKLIEGLAKIFSPLL